MTSSLPIIFLEDRPTNIKIRQLVPQFASFYTKTLTRLHRPKPEKPDIFPAPYVSLAAAFFGAAGSIWFHAAIGWDFTKNASRKRLRLLQNGGSCTEGQVHQSDACTSWNSTDHGHLEILELCWSLYWTIGSQRITGLHGRKGIGNPDMATKVCAFWRAVISWSKRLCLAAFVAVFCTSPTTSFSVEFTAVNFASCARSLLCWVCCKAVHSNWNTMVTNDGSGCHLWAKTATKI